jgi:glutamate dehydrogenase (NAD(P)+)
MKAAGQVTLIDPKTGLRAELMVDSLISGQAMGGVRMTPDVNASEVAALARKMTLKLSLAGLPIGGAKAGIVSSLPLGTDRDRWLEAFGRIVSPFLHDGLYLGSDQGISYRDRSLMFDAAGFDMGATPYGSRVPCTWSELWDRCDGVTGYGVVESIDAIAARSDLRMENRTVVVQGFGVVGRAVADRLARKGFRIVAVADRWGTVSDPGGLPVPELLDATDVTGTIHRDRLPAGATTTSATDAWLDVDAGVLVLAANPYAVNESNVHRVTARLVAEAGNIPTAPVARSLLERRHIAVIPDFLCNVGGACATALVLTGVIPSGLSLDGLVEWIYDDVGQRVRDNTQVVWELAADSGMSMHDIALSIARTRADHDRVVDVRSVQKVGLASGDDVVQRLESEPSSV